MNNLDKKINKVCRKIEKEFHGKVVCGQLTKREEIATMPVSIIKQAKNDENTSSYDQPVGVIEIRNNDKIRFVPLDRQVSTSRSLLKLLVLTLTVFGIRKLFKAERKWESDT